MAGDGVYVATLERAAAAAETRKIERRGRWVPEWPVVLKDLIRSSDNPGAERPGSSFTLAPVDGSLQIH
jgi:hypothetical protein